MIHNFGGDGLSHYAVWFELHQADLPHGLNPWGLFELYQTNFPYGLSYPKQICCMVCVFRGGLSYTK